MSNSDYIEDIIVKFENESRKENESKDSDTNLKDMCWDEAIMELYVESDNSEEIVDIEDGNTDSKKYISSSKTVTFEENIFIQSNSDRDCMNEVQEIDSVLKSNTNSSQTEFNLPNYSEIDINYSHTEIKSNYIPTPPPLPPFVSSTRPPSYTQFSSHNSNYQSFPQSYIVPNPPLPQYNGNEVKSILKNPYVLHEIKENELYNSSHFINEEALHILKKSISEEEDLNSEIFSDVQTDSSNSCIEANDTDSIEVNPSNEEMNEDLNIELDSIESKDKESNLNKSLITSLRELFENDIVNDDLLIQRAEEILREEIEAQCFDEYEIIKNESQIEKSQMDTCIDKKPPIEWYDQAYMLDTEAFIELSNNESSHLEKEKYSENVEIQTNEFNSIQLKSNPNNLIGFDYPALIVFSIALILIGITCGYLATFKNVNNILG